MARRYVRYEVGLRLRGVDVSHAGLDELGLSADRSAEHSNSGGPSLDDVLTALRIPAETAALDLGCGKAGALLTLHKHFRQADGVDLSAELLAVAAKNLRKCGVQARLIHADAAEFQDYDCYGVVYMFNPFPACVLETAMRNLVQSLERAPRPFWLIYKNPKHHQAVTAAGFQVVSEFAGGNLPVRVYRIGPR
jgi:SAM-dependent methyltransferase